MIEIRIKQFFAQYPINKEGFKLAKMFLDICQKEILKNEGN